jgi:hypothetical protein
MRSFAKRLITCEADESHSNNNHAPDVLNVCEKLRPQLATLMGNAGFRALVSRSLALASAEVPWLRAVQVKPDGSLEGLEEIHTQLSSDARFVGRVALLAQLLGLMVAFIGENLTLRLVREAWPKALLNDLDLQEGTINEKTN